MKMGNGRQRVLT